MTSTTSTTPSEPLDQQNVARLTLKTELRFWALIAGLVALVLALKGSLVLVAWLAFALAAFSAIGNDSIQTLGTFISSNRKVPWWILAAFISAVLAAVFIWGGIVQGDTTFGRGEKLAKIPGLGEGFLYVQLIAPILLLILTRYGIPVSTTFLLLSVFTIAQYGTLDDVFTGITSGGSLLNDMLTKSLGGYLLAFITGLVVWAITSAIVKAITHAREEPPGVSHPGWRVLQWISTSLLWSIWLMQDTVNALVFIVTDYDPATGSDGLEPWQVFLATAICVAVVFITMSGRGGRIQKVVTEKSRTEDVRSATIVDFVYAGLLFYKQFENSVPMSTTWVFLGLLAGRQFGFAITGTGKGWLGACVLTGRDLLKASLGIAVSLTLVLVGVALSDPAVTKDGPIGTLKDTAEKTGGAVVEGTEQIADQIRDAAAQIVGDQQQPAGTP